MLLEKEDPPEAAPVVDTTKVDSTIVPTVDSVAAVTPSVEEVK